ncbi:MAG: GNAT family N-acetyltransferase [Ignavibacteriaceae bacterium]
MFLKKTDIFEYKENELANQQLIEIITLINNEWPNPEKSIGVLVDEIREKITLGQKSNDIRFVIWNEEKCIAHARIFPCKIFTPSNELIVIALADVCVSKSRRKEGLGKALVEKAFEEVKKHEGMVCLFQTDIPKFYEKLDSKIVMNKFHNSKNTKNPKANPWWNDYVMIFPSYINFPPGNIDLNGYGY